MSALPNVKKFNIPNQPYVPPPPSLLSFPTSHYPILLFFSPLFLFLLLLFFYIRYSILRQKFQALSSSGYDLLNRMLVCQHTFCSPLFSSFPLFDPLLLFSSFLVFCLFSNLVVHSSFNFCYYLYSLHFQTYDPSKRITAEEALRHPYPSIFYHFTSSFFLLSSSILPSFCTFSFFLLFFFISLLLVFVLPHSPSSPLPSPPLIPPLPPPPSPPSSPPSFSPSPHSLFFLFFFIYIFFN